MQSFFDFWTWSFSRSSIRSVRILLLMTRFLLASLIRKYIFPQLLLLPTPWSSILLTFVDRTYSSWQPTIFFSVSLGRKWSCLIDWLIVIVNPLIPPLFHTDIVCLLHCNFPSLFSLKYLDHFLVDSLKLIWSFWFFENFDDVFT